MIPSPEADSSLPMDKKGPLPDPHNRGEKFYRPSSTTLSDTDSDREKEMKHMHMWMASMENKIWQKEKKRQREEKKVEDKYAQLKAQQQCPPLQ